ncbi:MAG: hypothetical protein PHH14_01350 [Candidatus Margulisbacteria bacterium]|nr:hypothetical protein [Candidatus Margulisiibacteriota bacterium]
MKKILLGLFVLFCCFGICYAMGGSAPDQTGDEEKAYIANVKNIPVVREQDGSIYEGNTKTERKYRTYSTTISIPLDGDISKVHDRAHKVLTMFADMPIKTLTDYVIETENPATRDNPGYGYSVSIEKLSDKYSVLVKCFSSHPPTSTSAFAGRPDINVRILAYDLSTGVFKRNLLYRHSEDLNNIWGNE